ncbi:MAG TPA: hypothetical protein VG452_00585 [Egibacteraceae bacterium]|nr:hypothetical protein [Actinomycetota bacterium]HWB70686.1 hypothetical protein [Egibacteraceae bacterium]
MALDRLTKYLRARSDERLVLRYDEIEQITGTLLPASARRHAPAFWSDRSVYAEAWTRAGFRAQTTGLGPEQVAFIRVAPAVPAGREAGGEPAAELAPLTAHLQGSSLHWIVLGPSEIEDLVGKPLPGGLRRHLRAWQNPLSRYAPAWRSAGYQVRRAQSSAGDLAFVHHRAATSRLVRRRSGPGPAVLLVGDPQAPGDIARTGEDLSRSDLFGRRRRHAESRGLPWLVLSTVCGLVDPDTVVAVPTGERALPDRAAWGRGVVEALAVRAGPLEGLGVEIHADDALAGPVVERLRAAGAVVDLPLEDLAADDQLRWYAEAAATDGAPPPVPATEVVAERPAEPPHGAPPVVRTLLHFGKQLASEEVRPYFTRDPEANALVLTDPFAYLLGVVVERGADVESEWALPHRLKQRLGHLEPARLDAAPQTVRAAIAQQPALHEQADAVAADVVAAARRVVGRFGGDAAALWSGASSESELSARLEDFPGIGPAKSAAVVELLKRLLRTPLSPFKADAVACDEHVRRVLLRTGLVDRDGEGDLLDALRASHAGPPSALQYPAWEVGRRWCHPTLPNCAACVLSADCAKLLQRSQDARER